MKKIHWFLLKIPHSRTAKQKQFTSREIGNWLVVEQMKKRNYNERGDNMSRTEINEIYEEHFVALSKAAKNKCSGEE